MMKRVLSILLIGLFLFSMVACGENKTEGTDSKTEGNKTAEVKNDAKTTETEYGTLSWATIGPGKLLPIPKSDKGEVAWDYPEYFAAYVADTSKADYDEYVSQCQDKGFVLNYTKNNDSYWADNEDGYTVILRYEDDFVMFVRIEKSEEESEVPDDNDINTSESNSGLESTEVSVDFKTLMDSYEEFFDSYVAFMKKYKASTDQVSMMGDLADYMSKYSDMMAKLNAIDSKSLSDADAAYYVEVSARVMKKLAEVA